MNRTTRLKIVAAGVTPPIYKCYSFSWANGSLLLGLIQFDSTLGDPDILIDGNDPVPNIIMPVDLTDPPSTIRTNILAAMALAPQLSFSDIRVEDDGSDTTVTFIGFLSNNYYPAIFSVDGSGGAINEITCPTDSFLLLQSGGLLLLQSGGKIILQSS